MEQLKSYGTTCCPNISNLTEEQISKLKFKDEWTEKCVPIGDWKLNRDPLGRRNGKQPNEDMQNVITRAIEEAKASISKALLLYLLFSLYTYIFRKVLHYKLNL